MRIEKDALGELPVPDEAYYGIQTVRCSGNYDVTRHTYSEYPEVIRAMAEVKKACAITNAQIGALGRRKSEAIVQACDEMIAGRFDKEFRVKIYRSQGTGVNMNTNEVLANRANEILTGHRGYDQVHPNTHVNMCQSSNDVFPTAENIVFHRLIDKLGKSAEHFETVLRSKALEFKDTVRLARTGMQDAVPNTWGQVFGGWQCMIQRTRRALLSYSSVFQNIVLGGTAVGTGMGQQPGYAEHIYQNLSSVLGFEVRWARMDNEVIPDSAIFDGMRNTDHQMMLAAHVKALATAAGRIASDLMLVSSGPRSGLREVTLPKFGKGSSGYELGNEPYLPEVMMQVAHQAIAAEQMATYAANEDQLDHGSSNSGGFIELIDTMKTLTQALLLFADQCVAGVRVDEEVCRRNAEYSGSLSTMVSALYGYPTGVKIAKLAEKEGITCKEAALQEHLLPPGVAEELFDVRRLTDRKATVEMFRKYGKLRKIS